jgi:hypothetical protein
VRKLALAVLPFVAFVATATSTADAADKPRVLILGDSISIGYTPYVQKLLADEAVVQRPKGNCAGTNNGIKNIDAWLKLDGGKWDVVHYNFGLHDLKGVDAKGKNSNDATAPRQADLATYEKQLDAITAKIVATGAKAIFATTTPYPAGVTPHRDPADAERYNAVARKVAAKCGVAIDDLHGFAKPRLESIQRPVNVHFTPEGSKALAGEVAKSIRAALEDTTE